MRKLKLFKSAEQSVPGVFFLLMLYSGRVIYPYMENMGDSRLSTLLTATPFLVRLKLRTYKKFREEQASVRPKEPWESWCASIMFSKRAKWHTDAVFARPDGCLYRNTGRRCSSTTPKPKKGVWRLNAELTRGGEAMSLPASWYPTYSYRYKADVWRLGERGITGLK